MEEVDLRFGKKSENINSSDKMKLYEIPENDKINLFTRMELTFTVLSSGYSLKKNHTHKIKKWGLLRMEIFS